MTFLNACYITCTGCKVLKFIWVGPFNFFILSGRDEMYSCPLDSPKGLEHTAMYSMNVMESSGQVPINVRSHLDVI